MMYNIRSGAIRWQIPVFLSDGNSHVCIFQRLLVKIFDLDDLGQSRSTIFTMNNDANRCKCQNLQTFFFTFCIFAKVRPVRTKVTDTQTDTQADIHRN